VKNLLTGFICTCLLVLAGIVPGRAQEQTAESQPADWAAPAADMPDDQAAPPQQTPPPEQATPTPAQTPTGQPASPSPEEGPTQHPGIPQPPPPLPKVPDVRRPGESGFYIGLAGWFPKEQPYFNRANTADFVGDSFLQFQGTPKYARMAEIGAAAGLHNTIKLTYIDFGASGNFTSNEALVLWAQPYVTDTYLSTNYRVWNVKLSYEYLTWPYPVGSRKFRLKTLWQAQFTYATSAFDAPLDYFDTNGNPIINSATGQPETFSASRERKIFSPMFGLGASYYPSRHLRLEFNGSGFGWPHRYTIWDTDASVNVRVLGHFEIRLGAKAFDFKTSTHADYYMWGRFASAFFGLRWYSNSE
jgi:hypothetical protein